MSNRPELEPTEGEKMMAKVLWTCLSAIALALTAKLCLWILGINV